MPRLGGAGRGAEVHGDRSGMVRSAGGVTVGVEEEFVLLDPSNGAVVLAAPDLVRVLGGEPGVQQELMRFQVEIATPVCAGLDDVGRELARLRQLVAEAAAQLGCRLVASGIAPYRTPGLAAVTDQPRYRELARRYSGLVADAGTCSCHVHVGVPSRDLGVQVLARLRPWLASLLAVTVNSPIADGHDTAWASWRYPLWSRWPTATAPAVWGSAAAYDAVVRGLIARGAALDERAVYILARLSPRFPTVEVRVADVCLDVGTAVLLAGLTRALVATALTEARQGTPPPAAPAPWVDAALTAAARHGLAGAAVDPVHRPARRCAQPAVPPARPRPGRAQRPRRRRAHHHTGGPARPPGYWGRPPAGPLRCRRVRARVRPSTRPRHAIQRRAPAQRKIRAATGARGRQDRLSS